MSCGIIRVSFVNCKVCVEQNPIFDWNIGKTDSTFSHCAPKVVNSTFLRAW